MPHFESVFAASPTHRDITAPRPRVLIVPGLHGSGAAHWQTWLQHQFADAVRVEQDDWRRADLHGWAERIRATVRAERPARWIAVAHSFGCLALARYLGQGGAGIASALLVAPADPERFAIVDRLPLQPLGVRSVMIGSRSDPWMRLAKAQAWALLWAARFVDLGDAGHINVDSGFGPFPLARQHVDRMIDAARPAAPFPQATHQDQALSFSFAA